MFRLLPHRQGVERQAEGGVVVPYATVPVLRGFTEIELLWSLAQEHGAVICGGYARYCASPRKNPVPATDVDLFPNRTARMSVC